MAVKFDYRIILNNPLNCPRCSVRLCVIQFTRCRISLSSLEVSLFILAHLVELVKNFFQILLSFLCLPCAPSQGRSSRNFFILSHRFPFVKNFFQVFSNFFAADIHFLRPLRTACIYYHVVSDLSSTFSQKLTFSFVCFY